MNDIINKKWVLVASGFSLILMLSFYVLYSTPNTQHIISTKDINYVEKLSGFPINTLIKINRITQSNVHSEQFSIDSNNPVYSNDKTSKILQNSKHYSVYYTAQIPKQTYLDIELNINKRTNKIIAAISGLSPKTNVSLNLDQQEYFTDTPADWAGRLTLQLNNAAILNKNRICLKIESANQNIPLSICHHITNTAERRAS